MVSNREGELTQRFLALQGIAAEAAALAMHHFENRDSLAVSLKGAQDWLTEADGAVEALIRRRVGEAFPQDGVLGEEGGGEITDRLWIVDPIDGTANFAHGDRTWCVSIGFLQDGVPQLGCIAAPALGETYLARKGGGATLNGRTIRAAATNDIARSTLEHGWSPRLPVERYLETVGRLFRAGANVKRSASGALGLAAVACGRTDGYVEGHINSWDVAGGVVIAAEAGAHVSGFFSGDWSNGNPIIVAAPGIAEALYRVSGTALSAAATGSD
jgi:myo-inositol-1(or 4)-monophosphatase